MDTLLPVPFESVGYKQKEFGFQLLKLEDVILLSSARKVNPFTPSRINFFVIILMTEGSMTHEIDFVQYKMFKGDCIFIAKGQIHKFDPSPTYKGYGLIFTEEYLLHHVSSSALSKISFLYNNHIDPLFFKDTGDLDLLIEAIDKEFAFDQGNLKVDVVASMLTVFLLKAQLQTNVTHAKSGSFGQFLEFQRLVANRYMNTRKVGCYARYLNTTYKQLNKLCKDFTKRTAKEYIDHYVVLEAKRRLAISLKPVKQIAYDCGFSEVTNFLKFFKKISGFTPSQFREMKDRHSAGLVSIKPRNAN